MPQMPPMPVMQTASKLLPKPKMVPNRVEVLPDAARLATLEELHKFLKVLNLEDFKIDYCSSCKRIQIATSKCLKVRAKLLWIN